MIKQIQRDTEVAVESIRQGKREVENGTQLAKRAGEVLVQIVEGAGQVSTIISQVAQSSEVQSATAEEIGKNLESIRQVTHENSEGVHQIARAAEDLNNLTAELQSLLDSFRIQQLHAVRSGYQKNNVSLPLPR